MSEKLRYSSSQENTDQSRARWIASHREFSLECLRLKDPEKYRLVYPREMMEIQLLKEKAAGRVFEN